MESHMADNHPSVRLLSHTWFLSSFALTQKNQKVKTPAKLHPAAQPPGSLLRHPPRPKNKRSYWCGVFRHLNIPLCVPLGTNHGYFISLCLFQVITCPVTKETGCARVGKGIFEVPPLFCLVIKTHIDKGSYSKSHTTPLEVGIFKPCSHFHPEDSKQII